MTSSEPGSITIYAPGVSGYFGRAGLAQVGGAETQIMLISSMLTSLGYQVRILTINVESGAEGEHYRMQIKAVWRSTQPFPWRLAGLCRGVISAASPVYLRVSRPTLDNVLVVVLSRLLQKRVVAGLASDLMVVPRRPGSRGWLASAIILRGATTLIAQTRRQRDRAASQYGSRAIVLSNFVDMSRFEGAYKPGFKDRDVDVLWVGSLVPVKGLDTVVDLAGKLPDTRFAVVGGSPQGSGKSADSAISKLRELPNVTLAGFVHPDMMPAWYRRARVLLHTPLVVTAGYLKEGFPNVFLEAWVSGIPVISTASDPDQLVSGGQLGILCAARSDVIGAIVRTTRNESEWLAFRDRVRAYAERRNSAGAECKSELVSALFGTKPAVRVVA